MKAEWTAAAAFGLIEGMLKYAVIAAIAGLSAAAVLLAGCANTIRAPAEPVEYLDRGAGDHLARPFRAHLAPHLARGSGELKGECEKCGRRTENHRAGASITARR